MSTETKIVEVIKDTLGVTDINLAQSFEDLGADSLDVLEVVFALEEAFDVDAPPGFEDKIQTVQDAVEYTSALVHGRSQNV